MRRVIEDELIANGIYPNLIGFEYVCIIVEYIIDSDRVIKIMKLYELVADIKNITTEAVERAIRTIVSKYNRGSDKKLCNSEFIYTLAWKIKGRYMKDE